jgi:hypothetical protein
LNNSENIKTYGGLIFMQKTLKTIKDYEDYSISECGEIIRNNKILSLRNTKTGYVLVDLYKNNKKVTRYVHRLVAQTFILNPDNLPCVNHKDENKANNSFNNLEWCTVRYNNNYGSKKESIKLINLGRKHSEETRKAMSERFSGEKHWNFSNKWDESAKEKNKLSQPNRRRIINITTGERYESVRDASRILSIPKTSIVNCCNGKQRQTHGFEWGWLDEKH